MKAVSLTLAQMMTGCNNPQFNDALRSGELTRSAKSSNLVLVTPELREWCRGSRSLYGDFDVFWAVVEAKMVDVEC